MITRADSAARRGERAPGSQAATERAGAVGAIAGLIAAVPLIGPALVAGCLGCIGIGAAAGVASTAALPPRWWLVGLGFATGAVAHLPAKTVGVKATGSVDPSARTYPGASDAPGARSRSGGTRRGRSASHDAQATSATVQAGQS